MRKLIAIFVLTASLWSCSNPAEREKPADVLTVAQLMPLLTDIHKADGLLGIEKVQKHKGAKEHLYAATLDKHGLSWEQFQTTMDYYAGYPEVMAEVYEQLLAQTDVLVKAEEAAAKKGKAEKEKAKEEQAKDE